MAVSRILNLKVVGGFLDGMNLEFASGLNCIIGSPGAGKTSVLEFLRYALDAMPDPEQCPAEQKRITKLIENNLDSGTISIRFQGQDGGVYIVSRSVAEPCVIQTEDGAATAASLNTLIRLHVHSQSEVEAIADDPDAQLELIDRFESEKLQQLAVRLRDSRNSLRTNASKVMELRDKLTSMEDQMAQLDVIEEKLSRLQPVVKDAAKEVQKGSDAKTLRQREAEAIAFGGTALREMQRRSTELSLTLRGALSEIAAKELREGPNGDAIREIHERLQATREWLDAQCKLLAQGLEREDAWLSQAQLKLLRVHQEQEQRFKILLDKHREMQGPARERAQLESQRFKLFALKREKETIDVQLAGLVRERAALLGEVADLQAMRFGLRDQIVKGINAGMDSQVRVTVENLGDQEDYRKLLEDRLRKAGIPKGGPVAQKLMSLTPSELVELLQARDAAGLKEKAGLNDQQAARVTPILAEHETILALEAVALRDKPRIELNDQGTFKPTADLSKGQKCTAVLPILLVEGHRPLLVDQPEDNLDNRFICRVIVDKIQKVKSNRQIIFATHNPNVVVLGAADRVFVLESNGQTSQLLRHGSVNERKGDILALLEGGAEAFNLRRERYGH